MAQYVTCPECGTKNSLPADAASKIDCSSCGMLLVLKKLEVLEDKPAAPARSSRRASAVSSRRGRAAAQAKAEAEAEEETPSRGGRRKSKSSSRRSTRGGGRRRVAPVEDEPPQETRVGGRAMRKNKNDLPPAVLWSSIAGLVCIVGAVIFFVMKNNDEPTKDEGATKAATTAQAEGDGDASGEDGDEAMSEDASGDADDEKTAAVSEEKPAAKAAAKKKTPKKKKSSKWEFTTFAKPTDVSDEDFAKMDEYIATMTDPNETRKAGIAQRELGKMPRAAVPALINALGALDPTDRDDLYKGQQIITALEIGTRGEVDLFENDSWKLFAWVEDTTSKDAKASFLTRKQAVRKWAKWWEKVGADWKPKVESEDDW